jgi:DNA-binding transcriptional LysR family regulator
MNIRSIDLNLLKVFDALMRERNTTRAASRLGLSQPAVSAALRRLRMQLGDPLFLRVQGGMRPTQRADQIFASVTQSLDAIQSAFQTGTPFAPAQSQRVFNVMMTDIGEIIYLPRLIEQLRRQAPGVQLSIRRLDRRRVHDDLASGAIDLAIGWMDRSGELNREDLFQENFVCIARRHHPRIRGTLTKSKFFAEWHLGVGTQSNTDMLFRSDAVPNSASYRKITLQVPHFLAVPHIVAHTDLLCVVPRQLAAVYAKLGEIRILELPTRSTAFKVSQFWHERFDSDQGSAWLRTVISGLFRGSSAR